MNPHELPNIDNADSINDNASMIIEAFSAVEYMHDTSVNTQYTNEGELLKMLLVTRNEKQYLCLSDSRGFGLLRPGDDVVQIVSLAEQTALDEVDSDEVVDYDKRTISVSGDIRVTADDLRDPDRLKEKFLAATYEAVSVDDGVEFEGTDAAHSDPDAVLYFEDVISNAIRLYEEQQQHLFGSEGDILRNDLNETIRIMTVPFTPQKITIGSRSPLALAKKHIS